MSGLRGRPRRVLICRRRTAFLWRGALIGSNANRRKNSRGCAGSTRHSAHAKDGEGQTDGKHHHVPQACSHCRDRTDLSGLRRRGLAPRAAPVAAVDRQPAQRHTFCLHALIRPLTRGFRERSRVPSRRAPLPSPSKPVCGTVPAASGHHDTLYPASYRPTGIVAPDIRPHSP